MLNIHNLVIPIEDIIEITLYEVGKNIKDALLHYYRHDSKKVSILEKYIDDKKEFLIFAKSYDELTRLLNLFESVNLVEDQSVRLRVFGLSIDDIYEVVKMYEDNDFIDKLYLPLDENGDFVSWEKFQTFRFELKAIKECIPTDASPLEIITYIYDYVKSKQYKEVPGEPKSHEARRVSNAMFDGYKVCVGFTKLFNLLLKEFNIPCTDYRFMYNEAGEENGHDISLANVMDPKYNINGLYFFDPSNDSYIHKDGNLNKTKYHHFLRTFKDYGTIDITEDSFSCYLRKDENSLKKGIEGMQKSAEKYHSDIFKNDTFKELVHTVGNLIGIADDLFPEAKHEFCYTDDAMLERVNINKFILDIKTKFGEDISPETLLELLKETHNEDDSFFLKAIWSRFKDSEDIYKIIENTKRRV